MERESKINNGLLPIEAAFNPVEMFSTMSRMIATQQNSNPNSTQMEIPLIRDMPVFKELESQLSDFRASFPPQLAGAVMPHGIRSIYDLSNGRNLKSVDGLLYLAHVIAAL